MIWEDGGPGLSIVYKTIQDVPYVIERSSQERWQCDQSGGPKASQVSMK